MSSFRCFSLSLTVSLFASAATAEEPPRGGVVYNMGRNEQIRYNCQSRSETDLVCKFTLATVSQPLPPEKIAEKREEALKAFDLPGAFEEFASETSETCEAVSEMEAEMAAGDPGDMARVPLADRNRVLDILRTICVKKDRASVEALIDFGLEVESRTCKVSSVVWTGTFSRNDDKTWVRTDKYDPAADGCGAVFLDRFVLTETGYFWNLVRRAIASNPNGTFTFGEKCSEIYTGEETEYKWEGGAFPAKCEYIQLNLFD